MFKAKDINGKIITIDEATRGGEYYCPFCNNQLITKMGNIVVHHFAHKASLCDNWYSENKGKWHRDMQNLFKKEYQEVILWKNNNKSTGEFHIADVCLPLSDGTNLIIEFQHSPMTKEEFFERNRFYTIGCIEDRKKPNTLVWIFDFRNKDMFFNKASESCYYCEITKSLLENFEDYYRKKSEEIAEKLKTADEAEIFKIIYNAFTNDLKGFGWRMDSDPCVFIRDFPFKFKKMSNTVCWKRPSKTFLDYEDYFECTKKFIRVYFCASFREWYETESVGYSIYGKQHIHKSKKFTDREGVPVFVKPTEFYSDWSKFEGTVINEEYFLKFTKKLFGKFLSE